MDCGRDEEAADLCDMFKHKVGMENEWEEMGEVEKGEEPGVTWHIQEMQMMFEQFSGILEGRW